MDPSSIITQVSRSPYELKDATKSENHEGHQEESHKYQLPVDPVIQCKRSEQQHQRFSGGGSGSRFLSQLLCCFGLGHSPDFVDRQQQQQQQPPELQKSQEQQALTEHTSSGQQLSNGQAPAHCEAGPGLLAPAEPDMASRMCAVIDLDETLVHSSFRPIGTPDFAIEVEVEGITHQVFVLKRPYADEFLARMGQLFECVLFTASMGKYADPVSDLIDPGGAFKHRLFREACVYHCDNYVKDLSTLGRHVDRCVIIDNSPASYMFNTENAIRVQSWMGEPEDTELRDLLPYLENLAAADSVSEFLRSRPPPLNPAVMTMEQMLLAHAEQQEMEDEC